MHRVSANRRCSPRSIPAAGRLVFPRTESKGNPDCRFAGMNVLTGAVVLVNGRGRDVVAAAVAVFVGG